MKGKAGLWVPHLGAAFSGLLDTVPNASIAVGVRRLRSGYTGPLMRIVRASDSSETDIGYTGASGDLDTSAIASFCSGTTGYVAKLYDQAGAGHGPHDAIGKDYGVNLDSLPIIYESGAVTTLNGKAAIKITHPRVFEWTEASAALSDFLTPGTFLNKRVTVHMVGYQGSGASSPYKVIIDSGGDILWCYESSSAERIDFVGTSASSGTTFADDAQKHWIWRVGGSPHSWHQNGTQLASSTNSSTQNTTQTNLTFYIGGLGFSTRNMEGYVQEVIIWKTAETVSAIHSLSNTYYSFP